MIDPQATPTAHHTPIPVPLHWQDEVKAGLDRDVRLGVLEQVPIGAPVTWCHRMVICAKKTGKPRRTIALCHQGNTPYTSTRHDQYHMEKGKPSSMLGMVTSPAIDTAPRYVASGDGYTRRYDEITSNKTKCVDDTLLWSDTIEESFAQWLDVCGRNGITLNPDKFTFAQNNVEFAGFEITRDTVTPCQKFIRAISNFPTLTDVRSWFGLVNQVSYTFSMTDAMLPFRPCYLFESQATNSTGTIRFSKHLKNKN